MHMHEKTISPEGAKCLTFRNAGLPMRVSRSTVPSPMDMLEVDSIEPLLLRTRTVTSEVADPSNACKSHIASLSHAELQSKHMHRDGRL